MAAVNREHELEHWIATQRDDVTGPWTAASSDASFRRYFRIPVANGTLIVMDAPPGQEDARPFVSVAERLRASAIHVPRILAADLERGFVLMTDLGAAGYLERLAGSGGDALIEDAFDALIRMQVHAPCDDLPAYDADRLRAELELFPAWYVQRHLGVEPDAEWWRDWDASCQILVENALAQPRVFVHRDFMARNLMVATPNPGVLDFQDAVAGPISYDPICLLRDAFHSWPPASEEAWLRHYHHRARDAGLPIFGGFDRFRCSADLMGAQRHLKVLGIFARLCHRDGKDDYIGDAPRFLDYLAREIAPYAALAPLRAALQALPVAPRRP